MQPFGTKVIREKLFRKKYGISLELMERITENTYRYMKGKQSFIYTWDSETLSWSNDNDLIISNKKNKQKKYYSIL